MRFFQRVKSLEAKILLLLMPPLVIVALAVSIAHGVIAYRQALNNFEIKQTRLSTLFTEHLGEHILSEDRHLIENALKAIALDPDVLFVTVFDRKGAQLAHVISPTFATDAQPVDIVRPISAEVIAGKSLPALGSLLIRFDRSRARTAAINEVTRDIISVMFIVAVLITGIMILNRTLIGRPLHRLAASVAAGEKNNAYAKVDWDTDDEIGVVIRTFNATQEERKIEYAALLRNRRLLADSETRARMIAEAIPVPVVIQWMADESVFYTNAAARDMLCPGVESPPDRVLENLFADQREQERFTDALRQGFVINNQESLLQRPDGRRFWGALAARRIDLDGRRAVLCTIHDISPHKEAEVALQAAKEAADNANHSKDMFLANTGHEIRTPLNAILGLSRLALSTDLTPEQWEHLSRIEVSASMLLGLVDDVLDFSKIGSETLELANEPFRFNDLLNGLSFIHDSAAEEKGLTLTVEQSGTIPTTIIGDQVRLSRILNNLLSNAVKYTEQGSITLRAHGEKSSESEKTIVRFTVRDTGPGMDRSKVSTLFQPFVQGDSSLTRKHGGTGLGLAIVKSIVSQMGSHVEVDTAPGKGSAFSFEVAFDSASEEETDRRLAYRQVPSLAGKRLLLVEDNEINRIVAQKILFRAGAAIEPAENGLAALATIETGADRFDAIIMDLQMPEMDGHEATRKIRESFSAEELPIIALTAHAHGAERERCLNEGMNDYLTKPIDPDVMVATIARIINASNEAHHTQGLAPVTASPPPPPIKTPRDERDLPGLDVNDAMSRMGGDFDLYKELLQMFHGIYINGLGVIRTPIVNGEMEEARRAAHSLKGVAGNISAIALHKAAAKLEMTIKEGGAPEAIATQLANVESELKPVLETTAQFA